MTEIPYRYELRQGDEIIATGHLTWPQPLAVGDQIEILGHAGTVQSIDPLIRELEQRIVVRIVAD